MPGSFLAASARTPIGKLGGALSSLTAMDLGGLAIAGALQRAGIAPDQVDHVVMGQVLQAGQGQNPARQAAVKAGLPMAVPAVTVNSVLWSGAPRIPKVPLQATQGGPCTDSRLRATVLDVSALTLDTDNAHL